MILTLWRSKKSNAERGQALLLAALTMAGLLGIAALGVDIGYLYVARNEVQNVADGAALAGARVLGHTYQGIPLAEQQGYICDASCEWTIDSTANYLAHQNHAAALEMDLLLEEVIIGKWDGDNFTVDDHMPDAVMVIARRDDVHNGPVATFFARLLGVDASSVNAYAIAALTGQSTAEPGEIDLPVGISKFFFRDPNQAFCDDEVVFHPTWDPASCAAWTSWDYGSNDITLRHILDEDEGYDSPETVANDTYFNFTGGDLSVWTFDALLSLFQRKGFDVDANWDYLLSDPTDPGSRVTQADPTADYYTIDATGAVHTGKKPVELWQVDKWGTPFRALYPDSTVRNWHRWDTTIPVYDWDDCANPRGSILIAGFAPIELRDVLNAPTKLVKAIVRCDYVDPLGGRGGGGEYGIKGSIPGLVR